MTSILAKLKKSREVKYQTTEELNALVGLAFDRIYKLYCDKLIDIMALAEGIADVYSGDSVIQALKENGFSVGEYTGNINQLYYEFQDEYFPGRVIFGISGYRLELTTTTFEGFLVKESLREDIYTAIISGIAKALFGSVHITKGETVSLSIEFKSTVLEYYCDRPAIFDTTIYCSYSNEDEVFKAGWSFVN